MTRIWHSSPSVVVITLALLSGRPALGAQGAPGFPRFAEGGVISTPLASSESEDGTRFYFAAGAHLNCVASTGRPCQGFPLHLGEKVHVVGSPAVGDVTGDGRREVVVALSDGRVAVVRDDGSSLDGFSFQSKASFEAGPALIDLDRDGKAEILVGAKDGRFFALKALGGEIPGFPLGFAQSVTSTAAEVPVPSGPGSRTAVVVGNEDGRLYAVELGGKQLPGFPVVSEYLISGQPAVADLDGNGYNDVVFASQDFKLYAVRRDGRPFPNFPVTTGARNLAGPALGDVDGDGKLDLVVGSFDGVVHAYALSGQPLSGFPVKVGDRLVGAVVLGDVDRDGKDEVAVATGDGHLHLLRAGGKQQPGFPAKIGAEPMAGPVLAETPDGAGLVVVPAGERVFGYKIRRVGKVTGPLSWPEPGHDGARTGRLHPNPPGYAELKIVPAKPATEDVLRAEYRFFDVDGDPEPAPDVRWFRDDKELPELAGKREVPREATRKKERWRFEISALGSVTRVSPEVLIVNTPPGRARLEFDPPLLRRAGAVRVKVTVEASDPDGDAVGYRFVWQRGGQPQPGLNKAELPPGLAKRGEHWAVVVTAQDGEADGPPMIIEATVEDSPPSAPEVVLSPATPKAGDPIRATLKKEATDADGDPLTYEYRFLLDGVAVPVSGTHDTLPPFVARKRQVVSVEVRADDGEITGPPGTAQLTVQNTPPSAPKPSVSPERPRRGEVVVAGLAVAARDADGDKLAYRYGFTCGGKKVGAADGREVAGPKKGDACELEVVAGDGEADSPPGTVRFSVGNTPPGPPVLAFESLPLRRAEPVRVKVVEPASDPDGDKVVLTWTWTKDGQIQKAFAGPELPAGAMRKGERWIVSATPSDGEESGPSVKLEAEVAGSPPTAPEIALEPAEPKAFDTIRAVIRKVSVDPDGEAVSYRYRFLVDGVAVAQEQTGDSLAPFSARKKQVVAVEVRGFDGESLGPPGLAKVTVANTPPAPPRVSLVPADPRQPDAVEVALLEPGSDADGDQLGYRYVFSSGGKKLPPPGEGRGPAGLKRGETYLVEAVALDGEAESAPAKATATVKNSPPTAPSVAFEKLPLVRTDPVKVKVVSPALDLDGDRVGYLWAWSRDGQPQKGLNGPELAAGTVRKGERWQVTVTASDGQASGPPARLEATVAGSPPAAPEVALTPSGAKADDAIRAEIKKEAGDADGDKVRYRFRFSIDGVPVPETAEPGVLPPGTARKKQTVAVEVVADDGETTGPPATARLTVANTPPQPPTVAIVPAEPRRGDLLQAVLTGPGSDADGDGLSYRFAFLKDGKKVAASGDGRSMAGAKKGETWDLEVVAFDGEDESAPARARVRLRNSPPSAPVVSFANDAPKSAEPVEVKLERPALDPDGDAVTYLYLFQVDGKPAGLAKDARSIPSGKTRRGQVWMVEVVATDGQESGPPGRARLVVANTPPGAPKVALEPAEPSAATGAKVRLVEPASDRDGDPLTYRYAWYRDGVKLALPPDAASVPPGELKGAKALRVVVVVSDGETDGPLVGAAAKVKNSPPTQPASAIEPASPTARDELVCSVTTPSTDPDGTTPELRFTWRRNGEPLPVGTGQARLPAGLARRGDTIGCEVVAGDGELSAAPVKATVKVANALPTSPAAVIQPETPRAGQDLHCRLSRVSEDADGDSIGYSFRWFEGGRQLQVDAKEPGVLPSTFLRKGVVFRCEVVASDGEGAAAPAVAEGSYRNSPPKRPGIRLAPSSPVGGQTLACEIAEESVDPDGDPVKYKFVWHKNGAEQSFAQSSAQVPARLVKAGDVWRCAVTPYDPELEGPRGVSEEVQVGREAAATR